MNADGFLSDVLAAPARLEAMLAAYTAPGSPLDALPSAMPERVVLIGMGSSRYAALAAAAQLRSRGIDAVAELASSGLPSLPRRGTLAVGISASGGTPETVEALARHHGASTTLALTNRPGSALDSVSDLSLPLLAGEEAGGVACITYQATLAVLFLLCGRLTGAPLEDELHAAVEAAHALREAHRAWLAPVAELLSGAHTVYTIAPAERFSSAAQSALMLREGPRLAAAATETGDWLHVDVYLSRHPGYRALLFAGSRFDAGVMEWARKRSSTIVSVGAEVAGAAASVTYPHAGSRIVATLVETGVAELLAAELWQRASAATS